MTPEEIKRARDICDAATPGPWNIYKEEKYFTPSSIWSSNKHAWNLEDEEFNDICSFSRDSEFGYGCDSHCEPDAQFIAEARTLLPKALDALDREKRLHQTAIAMLAVHPAIAMLAVHLEQEEKLRARIRQLEDDWEVWKSEN